MAIIRSLLGLLSKTLTLAAVSGVVAGTVLTIRPNFETTTVKCNVVMNTSNNESQTETSEPRDFKFEMGIGPFNYYDVDPSTITSNGYGQQQTNKIFKLINESKNNIKEYKQIRKIWKESKQTQIITGLTIDNQKEVHDKIVEVQEEFKLGLIIEISSIVFLIIAIIWLIVHSHREHKLFNKRLARARERIGDDRDFYNRSTKRPLSIDDEKFKN